MKNFDSSKIRIQLLVKMVHQRWLKLYSKLILIKGDLIQKTIGLIKRIDSKKQEAKVKRKKIASRLIHLYNLFIILQRCFILINIKRLIFLFIYSLLYI